MFGASLRAPIFRHIRAFAPAQSRLESPQLSPQAHADEAALMDAMRSDDLSPLMALYDRYSADVFALCIQVTTARAAAEDLLLSVFADLWERRRVLQVPQSGLRNLLLGMAQLRDQYKRDGEYGNP